MLVPKHRSSPLGVPIMIPDFESLTPPPVSAPDPIEILAARVQTRQDAITRRPGPTPTQSALSTALTIQGVKSELADLRRFLADEVIAEMKKDRDLERKSRDQGLESSKAWGDLVRASVWKIVAGGAVLFALIRELIAQLR